MKKKKQMEKKGFCNDCGKACIPLVCGLHKPASEYYCKDCHKSYEMPIEDVELLLQVEAQRMPSRR